MRGRPTKRRPRSSSCRGPRWRVSRIFRAGLETHDSLCRQLGLRSGAAAVALDYRLAPEQRFPVAVDDAWAAMRWLAAHSATFGLDGTRIDPAQRPDWRFAPLEVDALDAVAPACVVLAECDPLADEGLAYADRLRAAGVPVELELARGVTHDFKARARAARRRRGAGADRCRAEDRVRQSTLKASPA